MILNKISQAVILSSIVLLNACSEQTSSEQTTTIKTQQMEPKLINVNKQRLDIYTDFSLRSDLSHLSDNQKAMIAKLIDASKIMDVLFWKQAFGEDKSTFLAKFKNSGSNSQAPSILFKFVGLFNL